MEVLGHIGASAAIIERLVPQVDVGVNAVAVVATPPVVSDRQSVITEGALAVLRSRSLRFLVIRAPTGELDLAQLITVDDLAVDASGGRLQRCNH